MADTIQGSEGENLSRIRDILFGDDLQSIEQKLDTAKDENLATVDELKIEFEKRLKEIEQIQQNRLKEVDANQEKSLEFQKDSLNEIKQEIVNLRTSITDSIEQFDNKIANLENNINQSVNLLKEEYTLKINDLNKNKLDKNLFADMLVELAENLKK